MDVRRYVQGGQIMQGLIIYAVACVVLGLTFISLGDTFLGIAVCFCGPLWLAIANLAKEAKEAQEDDYEDEDEDDDLFEDDEFTQMDLEDEAELQHIK